MPLWEILAPALVLASVGVMAGLERLRPYDRQRFLREGFLADLVGYALAQSYVCAVVIAQLILWLDQASGLSRRGLLSGWPLWLQVVFFVVSHDLYIYWFHRWQHSNPVLWRLHEAHHSSSVIDWLAAMRSHTLEILINQTIEYAPMLLLGATPEVPLIKGAISAVWGLWIHANIDVRSGRLQWLINGPEAHRWHHALDRDAYNANFATKLAFWDRLFGTAFLPAGRKPAGYGLTGVDFPSGYLRQHLFAFRSSGIPRPAPPPQPAPEPPTSVAGAPRLLASSVARRVHS